MKIEKGQYIECLLKNGWICAGTVAGLDSTGLELIRDDNEGITLIMHPSEEISVIKIFYMNPSEPKKEVKATYKEQVNDLNSGALAAYKAETDEYPCEYKMPHEDPAKIKTLVELRKEMLRQEKENIANQLKSHAVGEVRKVEYGMPRTFKNSK